MFKRLVSAIVLALFMLFALSGAVLATWQLVFPTIVMDTSNTTRTYYPVMLGFGGQALVNAGKISANGTDTNMQIGGSDIKYMMSTTNVTAVMPTIPSGGVVTVNLYTGYSPAQTAFAIITGEGGYVRVADSASLELGDNFTVEQVGWVNTTAGSDKDLVIKPNVYRTYIQAGGTIRTAILANTTGNETLRPTAAGDETNLSPSTGTNWSCVSDSNDATYVSTTSTSYVQDLYTTANSSVNVGHINSVTIYFRITNSDGGTPGITCAKPNFKIGGSTYNGTEQGQSGAAGWATKSEVFSTSPSSGVAWTWTEINATQTGISLKRITAGDAKCAEVYITINYDLNTETLSLDISGVTSGIHTVKTTANTTHFIFEVDTSSNSTALGGASVLDNTSNMTFMQNDVMPYADNITISVNGTQELYFEPVTMLSGANIPDRSGNSHNGTIIWGSNSNINITYGEMTSYASYTATVGDIGGFDMPTSSMPSTWFASGENAADLPFYDVFSSVAVQTGQPVQMLYALAIIGVAFGAFIGIAVTSRSALMAYIAMVAIFGIGSTMTIIPAWIVFVMIVIGAGIMYLYRQVAY